MTGNGAEPRVEVTNVAADTPASGPAAASSPGPRPVDQAVEALEILRVAREQGEANATRHAEILSRIDVVQQRQDAIDARHGELAGLMQTFNNSQSEMARLLGEMRVAPPEPEPPPAPPPSDPEPPPARDPTPSRRRRYA